MNQYSVLGISNRFSTYRAMLCNCIKIPVPNIITIIIFIISIFIDIPIPLKKIHYKYNQRWLIDEQDDEL